METVFSVWLVPKFYKQGKSSSGVEPRVEAGSNRSTEALQIVGGDENGTPCLGVKLGHLVPGGYKYGVLALRSCRGGCDKRT
jgi:hypothetical protein